MDPAKWKKIKTLFAEVLESPDELRSDLLAREPDPEIRSEAEKLLNAHGGASGFIDRPFASDAGFDKDFADSLIGTTIDDYLLLEKIGEGGMGVVFLADHVGEGYSQRVALKLIKRGMDTNSILKRFLLERHILAQLEHPNISRMLDGGSTKDGLPYFVMEYVEGKSIRRHCDEAGLSVAERLDLFLKACDAISHAHRKLIVHRDVKPSNIIVDVDGVPKLLDFGIAKILSSDWRESTTDATAANLRLMTPEYASPEQLNGSATSTATDIYSLGVVLYELLTGSRPFDLKGKDPQDAAAEIMTSEPPLPSSVAISRSGNSARRLTNDAESGITAGSIPNPKTIRGDLDNIVLKAIKKDPNDRYASVDALADDIRRHLRGLPVSASADTIGYRLSKFMRRNRRALSVAAVIGVVFLAMGGTLIFQGALAARERDKANLRLERIRETARLLMTDTRESLTKIPGTSQIQKSLAEKSVELLDGFYDDSSTDVAFLSELADSYEKLCKTQNWQFRDIAGARHSCERSIALRRRVAEIGPGDPKRISEVAGALYTLSEVLVTEIDPRYPIAVKDEIESLLRKLASIEPNEERRTNLANHLIVNAEFFGRHGFPDRASQMRDEGMSILQQLISEGRANAKTPSQKTDLASRLIRQAEIFQEDGNPDRAFENYIESARIASEAYAADKTLRFAFNFVSSSNSRMGVIHEKRGELDQALAKYRFCFDWNGQKVNDPTFNKGEAIYVRSFFACRIATVENRLGRRTESIATLQGPLTDYLKYLDLEENAANLIYALEPFGNLTKYFLESGQRARAAELWLRYHDQLQRFLDRSPDDIGFINLKAESLNRLGDVECGYDRESDSFTAQGPAANKKAADHYRAAIALFRKVEESRPAPTSEPSRIPELEKKIERLK